MTRMAVITKSFAFLPRTFIPVPFITSRSTWAGRSRWCVVGSSNRWLSWPRSRRRRTTWCWLSLSDVEFFRPFTAEMFVRDGNVRFFRKPNQIDKRLPRHMTWHRVARALLGLPPAEPPYADYTGRRWPTAIAGQLQFSECVLYGLFVDGVIGAPANSFTSDDPLCLPYWEQTPLNLDSAAHFIRGVRPTASLR